MVVVQDLSVNIVVLFVLGVNVLKSKIDKILKIIFGNTFKKIKKY
jgi:hypothetical protein